MRQLPHIGVAFGAIGDQGNDRQQTPGGLRLTRGLAQIEARGIRDKVVIDQRQRVPDRLLPHAEIAPNDLVGIFARRQAQDVDLSVYLLLQANNASWLPSPATT